MTGNDISRPDLPGPTSHMFVSQRLRLHYNDWGNPDAPPLLLLHGGRDHSRNWDWVAERLRHDWHIIAPDLRGHGNSEWSPDGNYTMAAYIYDLAQLVHQLGYAQISLVAHSLGGQIALRYAGIYPEKVRRLVSVEGTGAVPPPIAERLSGPVGARFRDWITDRRQLSGRIPRRYQSIDEALARMQAENSNLSAEQARHLTVHAISQNEDGSWSWKFDNYIRSVWPVDMDAAEVDALLGAITCPVLLMWGARSWARHPARDGTAAKLQDSHIVEFAAAGHWLHHDMFERFIAELRAFL